MAGSCFDDLLWACSNKAVSSNSLRRRCAFEKERVVGLRFRCDLEIDRRRCEEFGGYRSEERNQIRSIGKFCTVIKDLTYSVERRLDYRLRLC